MKAFARYHNRLLTSGAAWSDENPLGGLNGAAMPWLLAMLALSVIAMVIDPSSLVELSIMLIGWVLSVLGLFYALVTFSVGAVSAYRTRRTQQANDR